MKSPFKFLDSYTKDDRDIFFGREREIEELYHRVFESKIMLVYGVSGTGKSSLIHCGLANKFQDTDWLPLVIRRGGNMPDSLADSIRSASLTPQTGEITTPSSDTLLCMIDDSSLPLPVFLQQQSRLLHPRHQVLNQ